ncbi:MAG TPA: hypothetical protein VI455_13255 [Terriglobia bacterium]
MAFERHNEQAEYPHEGPGEPGGAHGTPPVATGAASEPRPPRATSPLRRAASRANGRKSRGPVTDAGKQRASQNARKLPIRLLGLAEAKTLNQELASAEVLYRELIAPYEPAPPLLAMHFQDLARLRLELEAWERIRDAQLEDRWQQNDLKRRLLFHQMDRELPATMKEIAEGGLQHQEDSAGKFKEQMKYLAALKLKLTRRDFNLKFLLHNLYGKELDPKYARAQTICIRCERLMNPAGREPLSHEQFEGLLDLVAAEEQDAITAYRLELDQKTMTRAACLGRLGPTRHDIWMNLQGERLRQAIDRKQWVITGLLKAMGLIRPAALEAADETEDEVANGAVEQGQTGLP